MITKSGVSDKLLDITALEPGSDYHKVAYLYDIDVGTDRLEKGFFRMFLKDINGNIIIARMFNLNQNQTENFIEAKTLKGKAIDIYFRTDLYNGTLSLTLNSFELYSGLLDYSLFIGAVSNVEKSYQFITNIFEKSGVNNVKIPYTYKTDSFTSLCDGRMGGFIKLVEVVLLMLTSMDGIPGISHKELIDIWYLVQEGYYNYLKRLEFLDIMSNEEKIDMLYSFKRKIAGEDVSIYAVDTYSSLIGFSKPQTVQSVILCNTINGVIETMRLACVNNSMVPGSTRMDNNLVLIKY